MTQNNPANLKVKAGDPLSAKLWNRTIDRIVAGKNGYGGAIDLYGQTLIPYLVTQGSVDMGDLVHINGFDGHQDDANIYDLGAQLRFTGTTPVWDQNITRICIAAEPAQNDEQVFGCISGLALVRTTQDSTKRFIQVDPNNPKRAKQATGGFAKVLFEYGQGFTLVDMGERQNIWKYELTEDVDAGATETDCKLLELDDSEYHDSITMKFEPPVECKLEEGDKGLVVQCGNEWFALTSCSSFLGCPVEKDLMLFELGQSPQWIGCDLGGYHQKLKVFECDTTQAPWTIESPTAEKAVATSLSCTTKECGECVWQYQDTPVPAWNKLSSCSFGCNCEEPVIANPQPLELRTTKCYGASGEVGYLCFTLLTENVTVWDCGGGGVGTDECCIEIFPPADCPDPCDVPPSPP